ncbi:MAG: hypothetical protein LBB77_10295 [Treponema sp.]|nr:hypothetical protein [Treponema sp.]
MVEPLYHRDPSLALGGTYAVVLTEDDEFFTDGGPQQYLSVYDIAGNRGPPIPRLSPGPVAVPGGRRIHPGPKAHGGTLQRPL